MVNIAFVNYLDQFPNLTESLAIMIITNKTTFEQTLPNSLNESNFDFNLLTASSNLKEFVHQYTCKKEIFHLKERHENDNMALITNRYFFSDNYVMDVFLFITAIISLLATTLIIYLLCKHRKPTTLIASLVLQQVKEVGAVTQKEINTECKILTYMSLALTILGLVMVEILHYRKSKLCRGHMFSNAVLINDIHFGCTILCTYEIMQNCKKHPSIQNYRHAKFRKY